MSDSQEPENSRTDTQDTYYEKTDATETLNESQDFHLFDVDDAEELSSDKSEQNSEKRELHDKESRSNETCLTKAEAVVTNPLQTESQREIASEDSKKDKQMVESVKVAEEREIIEDTSNLEMKEMISDEEDDVVQGTPPQIYSPSKRQLASIGETTPLKRKAELFDEPACKILRTVSEENALTFDRERSDEANSKHLIKVQEKAVFEKGNVVEDTEALDQDKDTTSLHSSMEDIIEETQEMECDTEPADERVSGRAIGILEKAEKDLDHRMQECSGRIGLSFGLEDCQASEKSDRTDQNPYVHECEDSNDLTKLNQSSACESNGRQGSVGDTKVRALDETMEKERLQDKSASSDNKETELNLNKVHVKQSSEIFKKLENLEEKSGLSESELESNVKDSDENMDVQSVSSNNEHSIKSKSSASTVEASKVSSNKDSDSYNKENDSDLKADNMSQKKETDYSSETVPQINTNNSRMSIELVYESKSASQESKPKLMEIVEIDEDGEHIIIDSSQEEHDLKDFEKSCLNNSENEAAHKSSSTSDRDYKSIGSVKGPANDFNSECQLTNGSDGSKKDDVERKIDTGSDIFVDESVTKHANQRENLNVQTLTRSTSKKPKITATVSKSSDCLEVLLTDSEGDCSMLNENIKNKSLLETSLARNSLNRKELQVKREIGFYVRLECLLHVDENTKEFVSKELTSVQCDSIAEITSSIHQSNNDTSGSLADISGNDNKDSPLGSVNSNPQPYTLLPSRLSFISTVSSSSSASSAASLAAKFAMKDDLHFSLPRGPAKHAKKQMTSEDKLSTDDFNRLTKEWKNTDLLVTTVLNSVNLELQSGYFHNGGIEGIEDPLRKIQSSTPEVVQSEKITTAIETMTPKSRKKSTSRARSKGTRTPRSNGSTKVATSTNVILAAEDSGNAASSLKKSDKSTDVYSMSEGTTASVDSSSSLKQNLKTIEALKSLTAQNLPNDELLGKEVFAKWSDKNYYPGTVTDRSKAKFMVNFHDGQSKLLQQEFIIPIPKTLNEGLSVYATTKEDDYGSSGMIINVETIKGTVYYTVETDEGEQIQVQIKDIFLTCDQAQILREMVSVEKNNLTLTPQHMGQITLDNMIDGKRRSRRIATPNASTPKLFRKISSSSTDKNADTVEPSVSGINSRLGGTERLYSENESRTSDSSSSVVEKIDLYGVQPDLVENSSKQVTKGSSSRVKGKARNRKKSEDDETIATLGPIPPSNSNIFKGMSFILTCAPLETSDKYQMISEDSNTDSGTEHEGDWTKLPFVANRLTKQLTVGGGKVYENFEDIPPDEYKNTKVITNVPNITAKSLQCLAVGIHMYNHEWIIYCCKQNEMVNPDQHVLPAGWSLDNRSYVEMDQRLNDKPLTGCVVVIPTLQSNKQFVPFWYQICENAGGIVLLIDNPEINFDHGTIVLTNHQCPAWVVEKANSWQIPLVSTTWITQCLIEGKICPYDTQPCYKYNYSKV